MPEEIGGPYVSLACFCEKTLEEKDGVMSLIRIPDRFMISAGQGAPEQMPPITINTNLVMKLFSGTIQGSYNLKLDLISPTGLEVQKANFSLLFEGNDRAVQAVVNIIFQAPEQGLYWVNLYFEEALLTRIPLRLIYQRVVS